MKKDNFYLNKDADFAGLDEEMKEIEQFFYDVERIKKTILTNKETGEFKEMKILKNSQILALIKNNIKFEDSITDDTMRIYIDTAFNIVQERSILSESSNEISIMNEDNMYIFSEDSLESFLTSVFIFVKN